MLIKRKVLVSEAKRIGIKVTKEEIENELRRCFEGNEEEFKKYRRYPERYRSLQEDIKNKLFCTKVRDLFLDTVKVTELEVSDYITKRKINLKKMPVDQVKLYLTQYKKEMAYVEWCNNLLKNAKISKDKKFLEGERT